MPLKQLHSFQITDLSVQDKPANFTIILKSPSHKDNEEMREEYSRWHTKYMFNGIATREMILNKYQDVAGGIFSKEEKDKLDLLRGQLKKIREDYILIPTPIEDEDGNSDINPENE